MIPWPFLFCQKPIVRAPVFAGTRQTFAVTDELPVSSRSLSGSCTLNVAVLFTVTQSCGTFTTHGDDVVERLRRAGDVASADVVHDLAGIDALPDRPVELPSEARSRCLRSDEIGRRRRPAIALAASGLDLERVVLAAARVDRIAAAERADREDVDP